MSNGALILFSTLLYGAICICVGIKGMGRVHTSEGFFLAGRSFGWFIMVCSFGMAMYNGLALYGATAFTFRSGAGTNATTGFYITGLMWPLIGYKLWRLGSAKGYMTAADFLRDRFYSEGYGVFVALLQVLFIIPHLALQFDAVGVGLSVCSDNYITFRAAVALFVAFVGVYIIFGGAQAIGWLDIFNFLLAFSIPIIAAVWIISSVHGGSMVTMAETIQRDYPNWNTLPGPQGLWTPMNILGFMVTGNLAFIVSPHMISKFFMAKNKATFKQMAVATPVLCCSLLTGVALLCWCGVSIYAKTMTIADSDLMVPTMVLQHTPLFVNILMLWALFAFTATTADALGLAAATIISRDLVGRFFMKNMDEQRKDQLSVKVGKTCVLLMMPLVAWIAFNRPTFIVNYDYNFSGPGFASILPAVILGLYWSQATKEGAWAGTIAGLITLAVTLFYPPLMWPLGVHPVIWSQAANFLVFYAVSLMTQVPTKVAAEFHNVRLDGPYPAAGK